MSRVDDLIAELCPDGVGFLVLGEVIRESRERNSARKFTEVHSVTNSRGLVATTDFFDAVRTSADTANYKVVRPGMFAYNPARINVGSIGWSRELYPVIVSPMYAVFEIDSLRVRQEYLQVFFESNRGRAQIESRVETGARNRLTIDSLSRITLPIPPLQVQDLIVETLRPFSELTVELERELGARRVQWSHYLKHLDFRAGSDAFRWVSLSEVASVRHGRDFPLALQGRDSGAIPFLKVSDMTRPGNELAIETAGNYISANDLAGLSVVPTPEGTVLLPRVGAAVATNKKRLVTQPAIFDTSFLGVVPGPEILPRYLLYWMMALDLVTLSNSGGAVPSVRSSMLASRPFPMRSLAEQHRLVAIHDSFHDLVNDQKVGLPAELNARHQQHAHYCDELFAFGEVAV